MSLSIKKKTRVSNFAFALFLTLVFVPRAGIEPALPKEQDFESSASTSSATGALLIFNRTAKILIFFNWNKILQTFVQEFNPFFNCFCIFD